MVIDFDPEALAASVREFKKRWPSAKAVACGLPNEEQAICRSIEAGADGIVLATEALPQVIQAIRDVRAGILRIPPSATRPLFDRLVWFDTGSHSRGANRVPACLSTRETEILARVRRGESNKQIAVAMCLEVQTVKNHVTRLLRKLGVCSRHDAARVAGESAGE